MKLKRIHGIILFFAILFPTVIPNTTNTNVAISSDSVSLKSSKTNFDRFPIQNTNNKMISENMASKFSTGRSVIGAQWLIDNGFNGSNIKIGIIDSGVTNSSEFSSRFVAARSFVTIANGYSIDDLSLTEYIIHGSTVANYALGTTSGIAPGALLVSAKIFGSGTVTGNGDYRGEETTKAIVEAIYYMIEQNVSVINLSIGQYSNIVNDGRQYIIDKVSKEQNIIFVIAAGNEGYQGIDGSTIGTPGTAFQGITVGATDSLGLSMMGFSGSGLKVDYTVKPDLVAPGVGGTSFASPLVAGGVALLIQALNDNNLTVTPGAIKAALIESSNPIGD
ncbi:MAG: S8 family serine peptidase, partial [Candidatus Heimdallarchaeota archaeon]